MNTQQDLSKQDPARRVWKGAGPGSGTPAGKGQLLVPWQEQLCQDILEWAGSLPCRRGTPGLWDGQGTHPSVTSIPLGDVLGCSNPKSKQQGWGTRGVWWGEQWGVRMHYPTEPCPCPDTTAMDAPRPTNHGSPPLGGWGRAAAAPESPTPQGPPPLLGVHHSHQGTAGTGSPTTSDVLRGEQPGGSAAAPGTASASASAPGTDSAATAGAECSRGCCRAPCEQREQSEQSEQCDNVSSVSYVSRVSCVSYVSSVSSVSCVSCVSSVSYVSYVSSVSSVSYVSSMSSVSSVSSMSSLSSVSSLSSQSRVSSLSSLSSLSSVSSVTSMSSVSSVSTLSSLSSVSSMSSVSSVTILSSVSSMSSLSSVSSMSSLSRPHHHRHRATTTWARRRGEGRANHHARTASWRCQRDKDTSQRLEHDMVARGHRQHHSDTAPVASCPFDSWCPCFARGMSQDEHRLACASTPAPRGKGPAGDTVGT
ncbi:uncharacterized protein LOC127467450 isoform X5 [Manacus candei]|uniref:uncharacterized protein LOC127467450 isoform X5 n=1 Tax=Manacus candei TaxID=415023 RepID=UPI0022272A8A|nr:uncharacterized protein LOC127467450 isoform X5 [Manacus candei]